jgi:2-keto-3-deoxy-L-fuconate dehydrogenase
LRHSESDRRCNLCSGIAAVGNIEKATGAEMDRIFAVNCKGVYHVAQEGVKGMLADGKGGVIINLASIASLIGIKDRFVYGMSKGAVLTMTYSIATDYMHKGIRCNAIAPTRVHTPFVDGFIKKNYPGKEKEMFEKLSKYTPIGRMAQPKEVAALAYFLACDEAAMLTGSCYNVDGGVVTCMDAQEM